MLRGLYSATAGLIAQQRKHDSATNNITNLNTPGFKQVNVVTRSFPEMLISLVRGGSDQTTQSIGSLNGGVFAEEGLSTFLQGDIMPTDNPTDIAILSNIQVPGLLFDASGKALNDQGELVFQPQAFFTVENGEGEECYTRDGKFSVNEDGEWVTPTGHRLLDTNGQPIVIDNLSGNIQISPNGRIIDTVTGQQVLAADGVTPLAIRVSIIENPHQLIREGDGNYRLDPNAEPARLLNGDDTVELLQGYMERSNVDATAQMVDMMSALRAYEANQKIVQFYDRNMDKAVNEIGRV
ncbi:MAG: flagellar hook-basal body protein [Paenibacillaceae bacterium]